MKNRYQVKKGRTWPWCVVDTLKHTIGGGRYVKDVFYTRQEAIQLAKELNDKDCKKECLSQIASRMEQLASEPCKNGTVPIYPSTLLNWARQLQQYDI